MRVATKPRRIGTRRSPRTGEATCRRLKPREQWIAIPVPGKRPDDDTLPAKS
jgi:hypothetical protein